MEPKQRLHRKHYKVGPQKKQSLINGIITPINGLING